MSDDAGLPRRHGADDRPPYAPALSGRPSTELVEEPDVEPRTADSGVPATAADPAEASDQAEEAAAYAEAREQGVLPASALEAGVESGPATAALPRSDPEPHLEAGFAPGLPERADVRKGSAREAARQSRQQRAARPAASRRGGFRDEPIRTLVRGLGQTLITLGMVLLLFVVYEVYVTDLFGAQKQAAAKESMEQRWEVAAAPPTSATGTTGTTGTTESPATPPAPAAQVTDPGERTRKYSTEIGQGFANIYIPAFGADYNFTIVEGTATQDLYGHPGHYDNTQYPGELGNFAVAGHRVSKGAPFNALGTLSSCDALIIETQDDWFVYRVLPMPEEMAAWNAASRPQCADIAPLTGEYQDLAGREITVPSDYPQVLPVPHVNAAGPKAVAAATQRIITLTTCHPQFSDRERMIVHGVLAKSYAKAEGFLPPELSEG